MEFEVVSGPKSLDSHRMQDFALRVKDPNVERELLKFDSWATREIWKESGRLFGHQKFIADIRRIYKSCMRFDGGGSPVIDVHIDTEAMFDAKNRRVTMTPDWSEVRIQPTFRVITGCRDRVGNLRVPLYVTEALVLPNV